MTSARSKRPQHAMARKIVAFALAFMAPIAAAESDPPASQPTEAPKAATTADARTGPLVNAPSQRQPAAAPEAALPDATEIEISRRFNDLRRELLDGRAKTVDWWLAATAIFLTLSGIIAVIAGYLGFKRFREIETEARGNVESSRIHAEEARNLVVEIKTRRDEAVSLLKGLTAEDVHDDPDQARKAAESVQSDPTASPLDQAVADAVRLQQRGNIEEAIEKWRAIAVVSEMADKEFSAQAWFSVGYLSQEHKEGIPETAIDAYDKALQLNPDFSEAYNNRGNAKSSLGRHEEAIADYDAALQLKPEDAEVYNNRGVAKKNLGRHEEAIADYDAALQLKPEDAEVYNNRGVANDNFGRHMEAIADYDTAIKLDKDYAKAYNNRGNTKNSLGRHEEALADYDEALRLKPDYAEVYYNRGVTNVLLNRVDEARRDYETVISLARNAGDEALANDAERALKALSGEQAP